MKTNIFGIATILGLCVASAQNTLNMSQDLVKLGIAATNMVPNQPAQDAGPLFMQAVAYAQNHGISTVIADKGTYYFLSVTGNTHASVAQINNMTIDFQGSDLIFTHPLYYGLVVYYSTNAVLQNFTADYQPLPFTQVRVVSVDVANSQIQYVVQPGWQDPSAFNSLSPPPGLPTPTVLVYFFRNGERLFGQRRMAATRPFTGDRFTVSTAGIPTTPAPVRPGDVAVIAVSNPGDTVNANHCNSCTLRNITVFSSVAAPVLAAGAQGIVMERLYSIPKPGTDRLVSTFGFGLWFRGPNNQVRLSRAIRTMDDGIDVNGEILGTVQNQLTGRSLTIAGNGGSLLADRDTVSNGTPVSFQRLSNGAILGSAVIVSQTDPTGSPPQATFTFDRDLPGNLVGTWIYSTDPNHNGANSVLERNAFQYQTECCNGIFVNGLVNSTIRGNYIRRSAGSGVFLVDAVTSGTSPAGPNANLSLSNNVIDGTNITPDYWWFELGGIQSATLTSPCFCMYANSVFSNINISDNFIADAGRSAVFMANTAGGTVTGNYFLNPNVRPDPASQPPQYQSDALLPVAIDTTSSSVAVNHNTIDNTSGRMFVTDLQYRELAAYAPGSTIRLDAYNLGGLTNPTVTITDADGNTSPVVVQTKTSHALDVILPVMVGLGGAYLTLTSGNLKYFGTLFLDSQDNIPAVNGCTYETSMPSTSVPGGAANLSILVITQAGCQYQATDADSFVNPGASTTGTAVVSVGFARNTGAARMTTLEIAGQPITVTQTAVSLTHDFRAIGRSDSLLYDPVLGQEYTALSKGDGSYQYIPNLFSPAFDTLRTGDFNGDGKSDLVVYNSQTALAYIGISNGDGTFAFQSLFWSPGYDFVEAGDLNGDGKTDFALYNSSVGTMYTGIRNGMGGFTYKYALISRGYTFLRLADFTGDGKADIFLYNAITGAASLGIGDGTGGFTFHPLFMSPGYNLIDLGDLNGDGKTDLIVYNRTNGNAAAGISDGAGGLAFTGLLFSPGFTSVRLADYTGDGKADVTVYNKNNAAAYFGTGTGTGTFNFQSLFWSPGYDNVVPEDVNGDGKLDVVLYNTATGTEYTGISNGNGTFAYTYQYWGIGKVLAR